MGNVNLLPPCAYQGGKQRLASKIIDTILEKHSSNFIFYDLCCGSGSVSLELLNRHLDNVSVVMVDKGPFGAFWEAIGTKCVDIDVLKKEVDKIPSIEYISSYLKNLSNKPINEQFYIYHYLLLQAGSFGSKQIWSDDSKWCNNTFRGYWLPTEISNRRSPVNPMMPMPSTLLNRVKSLVNYTLENNTIIGYNIDIQDSLNLIKSDSRQKIIYIDPPYKGTTGYLSSFEIYDIIENLKGEHLFISEGVILNGVKDFVILSEGRKKGNVSGNIKKESIIEILNIF